MFGARQVGWIGQHAVGSKWRLQKGGEIWPADSRSRVSSEVGLDGETGDGC